jgi:hypothetical protein
MKRSKEPEHMESDGVAEAAGQTALEQQQQMETREPEAGGSAWSFVQMNMHLLPIARPLPVSVAAHRFQEGAALAGCKPRTPNQRLHDRVRHTGSNISPRRQDGAGVSAINVVIPPSVDRSSDQALLFHRDRAGSEDWHARPPRPIPPELRIRSWSDDVVVPPTPASPGQQDGSPPSTPVRPWSPYVQRRRASVTLSDNGDGVPKGQFKGKRILELQDEDRRLLPGETVTAPSPTKRSRRNL